MAWQPPPPRFLGQWQPWQAPLDAPAPGAPSSPEPAHADLDPEQLRLAGLCVLAAIGAYAVLALVVHCCGIEALRPVVLCWPDICRGRGCILYRILFCPCLLARHAVRTFCWSCCCTYLKAVWFCRCFEGWFWKKFTDPDFVPDYKSIGVLNGDTASGVIYVGNVEWKRASEICESEGQGRAQLFEGEIEAQDMQQGQIGDCWLIAALACVAQRPEILQRVIRSNRVDARGKYHFRLWNHIKMTPGTKWVDIVVDDFIPCHPGTTKPKFAKCNSNEMWAMLLEKAFAKMYGSYSALEGGVMAWGLSAMTGNPAVIFDRRNGRSWNALTQGKYLEDEFDDQQFFKFLQKLRHNGAFICCAGIAQANRQGLVDGHAYSILRLETVRKTMVSTEFYQLVQIRNPHGGGEWTGAWSDKSPLWKNFPYIERTLLGGEQLREDGAFWMQWQDFVKFWTGVHVVDCETSINTIATPVYNENHLCGPVTACTKGCFKYWCGCLGPKRLLFGRAGAKDLEAMKEGMDRRFGYNQDGFYCRLFQRTVEESSSESESESPAPRGPCCGGCRKTPPARPAARAVGPPAARAGPPARAPAPAAPAVQPGRAVVGPAVQPGRAVVGPAVQPGRAVVGPAVQPGRAVVGPAVQPGRAVVGPAVQPGRAVVGPAVQPGRAVVGPAVQPGRAVVGPAVQPGRAVAPFRLAGRLA